MLDKIEKEQENPLKTPVKPDPQENPSSSSGIEQGNNHDYIINEPLARPPSNGNPQESNGPDERKEISKEISIDNQEDHHFGRLSDTGCTYIMDDGSRCRASAIRGSSPPRCFMHCEESSIVERAKAARLAGGKGKVSRSLEDYTFREIRSPQQLERLLEVSLNGILLGTLHPSQGRVIASLANAMLKSMDLSNLEERLTALEDQLDRQKGR